MTKKSAPSIFWHDYEAFGADARRDRASQFAGIRTDLDLNEIEAPLMMYCQPAYDYLPHPQACLVTGITPQTAQQEGVPECEFIRRIHAAFSRPQTCVAGYNSIRFDDELTRQLLYRNFYDPYEREWKHGNSRWDIIDMLRLCHALRPEGLQWPKRDDGAVSFRLETLSAANGLLHENAHDALSDVRATIALARLVKQSQPRLYDYAYTLRQKSRVDSLLELSSHKPLLHAASIYPASRACLAVIMPLVAHPTDKNAVLTYDLSVDPAPWLTASVDELRAALFTPAQERAVDEIRLPVTVIHINRCPMLAPMSALPAERMTALMLDLAAIRRHWHALMKNTGFFQRVAQAMVSERTPDPAPDVDFMLYSGGFFADSDKRLMARWRQADSSQLRDYQQHAMAEARDGRLPEMLLRYRARNFAGSLTTDEHQHWLALCRSRLGLTHGDAEMPAENAPPELIAGVAPAGTTVQQCLSEITSLRAQSDVTSRDLQVLNDLEQWVRAVCLHLAK